MHAISRHNMVISRHEPPAVTTDRLIFLLPIVMHICHNQKRSIPYIFQHNPDFKGFGNENPPGVKLMQFHVHDEITGIILAGGKSRRMGRDKALLKVNGVRMIERVANVLRENFSRLLLIGDRHERFSDLDLPVLPDIYPGSSLGGLYTGLYHAATEYVFAVSCDLPFPNADVIRHLCSLRSGFDAVVPVSGRGYEPLFALYAKSCMAPIRAQLEHGEFCAHAYYPQIRVRHVLQEELACFDCDGRAFLNINTPEEFVRIGGEL